MKKTRKATEYYVLSTTNAKIEGWLIFGTYNSRKAAEYAIMHEIDAFEDKTQLHSDIYAQTLYKNARVATKYQLKRIYKIELNY